ncbi:A24 family peptidase [Enterobacter sp. CC120223-11]|uniref:prepilin peptidase n=1 Tax=Enterobacter sp. CC120223-11 TaxID=1378073 RepID=UPI000BC3FD00|nr:A24 family peptidase [Enterobacter sp. CC120223-11]SNY80163.1 leader peptidase HopD [Enterobacter sp. CC120223-11]
MPGYGYPFVLLYILLLVILAWRDYKTGLLPDSLTCPLLWCGLLFHVLLWPEKLDTAVVGAIAGYSSLALTYWLYRGIRRREGIGYGDLKFFAALGAWHGWQQLPLLITLATGLALLFVVVMLVVKRSGQVLKNPLRFGPFLSAAGLILGWQSWATLPL